MPLTFNDNLIIVLTETPEQNEAIPCGVDEPGWWDEKLDELRRELEWEGEK